MKTRGCALCELIAKLIESYLEISGKSDEVRRAQTSAYIQLHHNHGHSMVGLGFKPAGQRVVHLQLASTERSTPSKSIIQNLVNWDRVQGWLSHCIREHRCTRSEHSAVPEGFRLVHVENRCVTSEFGPDPKFGLDIKFVAFSVSKERKVLQFKSVIAGLELATPYPHLGHLLQSCKWNTRGWTYQEATLSTRKLVFTPFEVWFECNDPDDPYRREDEFSAQEEDQYAGYKARIAQFRIDLLPSGEIFAFTNFVSHLESYTARSLTNQSDILNAFKGVLAFVYQGGSCFHGLPEADFDQALLWYCEDNSRPTRCGEDCPSWSWTSVSAGVTAPVSHPFNGFIGTLVCWAYRDPETGVRAIRACNSLQPRPRPINRSIPSRDVRFGQQATVQTPDYSPQIHLLLAWWNGCIEAPVPDDLDQQLENYSEDSYSGIAGRWPTLEKVWDDVRKARTAGPEAFIDLSIGLGKEDQPLIDQLPSRALLTRAQTALFAVSRCQDDSSNQGLCIIDANSNRVGMIEAQDGSVTGLKLTESKESQDLCEFMAISLSQNHAKPGSGRMYPGRLDEENKLFSMHNWLFRGYGRNKNQDGQPVVNVLLIGRTEQSWLARRISVGWIYLADWCKAQREFKTIALE
ncbi:hypothetical protein NCS52_00295100 [Fusarium sp. LHS14.1]|nr:hypothetical protein NCS52_00295100 [Fusarium sp. LHS14.1]